MYSSCGEVRGMSSRESVQTKFLGCQSAGSALVPATSPCSCVGSPRCMLYTRARASSDSANTRAAATALRRRAGVSAQPCTQATGLGRVQH